MAKKAAPETPAHHGFNDVIGIVLGCTAVLLLLALLSYDAHDLPQNAAPQNATTHNWIGPVGARLGYVVFMFFGFASYLLPFILIFVGMGCFFSLLAFTRRRWPWAAVLFLCAIGMCDLFRSAFGGWQASHNAVPGGVLGRFLYGTVFSNFGKTGAFILFFMLIFISVLFLTNFQFGEWVRATFRRGEKPVKERDDAGDKSEQEIALE